MELTIKITGVEEQWLVEQVAERVAQVHNEHSAHKMDEEIRAAAVALVQKTAEVTAREKLEPMIAEIIEGKFMRAERNGYGGVREIGIKEMIGEFFATDQYRRQSWAYEMVERRVTEALKTEFQPVIEELRKALRDRLNTILGEKVSLAVREAVGLK